MIFILQVSILFLLCLHYFLITLYHACYLSYIWSHLMIGWEGGPGCKSQWESVIRWIVYQTLRRNSQTQIRNPFIENPAVCTITFKIEHWLFLNYPKYAMAIWLTATLGLSMLGICLETTPYSHPVTPKTNENYILDKNKMLTYIVGNVINHMSTINGANIALLIMKF